jgi:hypothetical protein
MIKEYKMKNLDIVYILRNSGTRWMNNEVKYSIRSVEKNFSFNNIWIIGNLPPFFNDKKIGNIKSDDPYSNKLKNALHKISLACKDERVSDNFILMNDDFFLLKKIDEIKFFNKGKLEASKKNHSTKGGYYYRAICNTLEALKDMGINNPIDYEVHYPIMINKRKFLETMDTISDSDGILFRSIYCNLNKIDSKYRRDVKIFDIKQLAKYKRNDIISTDDRVVTTDKFQKWIKEIFKEKTIYEKTPITVYTPKDMFFYNGKKYNNGDLILEEVSDLIASKNNLIKLKRLFYK